jgi:hypothetical protein
MLATYAALQDWDGVFLFAYSHNDQFEKGRMGSFFDIEGNPAKMMAMPVGARIFLGGHVNPIGPVIVHAPRVSLLREPSASYYDVWKFAIQCGATWEMARDHQFGIAFRRGFANDDPAMVPNPSRIVANRVLACRSEREAGRGRFILGEPAAAVFVGFAAGKEQLPLCGGYDGMPIDLVNRDGGRTGTDLKKLDVPFAAIMLVPADLRPNDPKFEDDEGHWTKADRLLLFAAGRVYNRGMAWDEKRKTVSDKWGGGPPRVEVVKATLRLPHEYTVRALDSAGRAIKEFGTVDKTLTIGDAPTVWYELVRRK